MPPMLSRAERGLPAEYFANAGWLVIYVKTLRLHDYSIYSLDSEPQYLSRPRRGRRRKNANG